VEEGLCMARREGEDSRKYTDTRLTSGDYPR